MDPEIFLEWLEIKGVAVRHARDQGLGESERRGYFGSTKRGYLDHPETEIQAVEQQFGPLPPGVRRWFEVDVPGRLEPNQIFGWQDGPWVPACLVDEFDVPFLAEGWNGDYRSLVELGCVPSHMLMLGLTTTIYLAVECVGPRAGWVYSISTIPRSSPLHDWARPVARSIEEFLDGIVAVTEAGLWVGGDSYGLVPPEPRLYPPPGMPLAYVAWTSQDYGMVSQPEVQTVVPEPPPGAAVLEGSVVAILGFEPPDRLSEPEGLKVVHDGNGIHPRNEET